MAVITAMLSVVMAAILVGAARVSESRADGKQYSQGCEDLLHNYSLDRLPAVGLGKVARIVVVALLASAHIVRTLTVAVGATDTVATSAAFGFKSMGGLRQQWQVDLAHVAR